MPTTDKIIDELQFISDKLSTQVRIVALGLLAIVWTILVGESGFLHKMSEALGKRLLLIAAMSILVLLVDFLQYLVGYKSVLNTLKLAEAQNLTETDFDPDNVLVKTRDILFWAKQIILIVDTVCFLVFLAGYIYS